MNILTGNGNGLSASYYNGLTSINTSAALTRIDKTIDFKWSHGSSSPLISNNNFLVKWKGKIQAESTGSYTFSTISDDGIRLWIDGKQLVNNWTDHAATQNKGTIALIAGQRYDIKMEYYQRAGDATVQLSWSADGIAKEIIPVTQLYSNDISAPNPIAIIPIVLPIPAPVAVVGNGDGLTAQYFNDKTLNAIALTRIDPTVDFDWQRGSPDPLVNNDGFSARWTGQVRAKYSEAYTFSTTSDDGVRLWVDGKPIIDDWTDHAPKGDTGAIVMVAGQKYSIKLEYYENMGGAVSRLAWSSAHQSQEIIPQSQLFSAIIPSTTPTPTPIIVPIVSPVQNSFDPAFHDSDRGVPNDAHPAGVPSNYSWYESSAQPGWGNSPRTDWHAATALGAVYAVENWHPEQAPNTRVQLRNDQLWILSKSSGKWTEAQYPTIQGGAFRSDFANNAGKGITTKDESNNGGGLSVTADQNYNFHFWAGRRADIDPNDIKCVYSVFQARLVLDDLSKPDDRASAHYLAGGGGDYWASQDASWKSDWSANGGINGGRMKFVTNDWKSFSMNTLSAEEMIKNPPPLTLVSY